MTEAAQTCLLFGQYIMTQYYTVKKSTHLSPLQQHQARRELLEMSRKLGDDDKSNKGCTSCLHSSTERTLIVTLFAIVPRVLSYIAGGSAVEVHNGALRLHLRRSHPPGIQQERK